MYCPICRIGPNFHHAFCRNKVILVLRLSFAELKRNEILNLGTGDHPENQVGDLLESCVADNLQTTRGSKTYRLLYFSMP